MRAVSAFATFSSRPLDLYDVPRAGSLARACGPHGVYVANFLARMEGGDADGDEGEVLACYGAQDIVALAWFGARGNLIVLQHGELDPEALARAIERCGWAWRIVLGPGPVVDGLARQLSYSPLVNREQVYYGMSPERVATDGVSAEVRRPEKADLRALVKAAVDLNYEDLGVDRKRVDRGWVRRAVRERIRKGTTRVLGPDGAPLCKLDFGSEGEAGRMLEGVYTFAEARGRGLATTLVTSVVGESRGTHPLVCLHVGAQNTAARRAYERAGMEPMGSCQLLLKS